MRSMNLKLVINRPTEANPFPIPRIRVWPRTELIRKTMKHPVGNISFRATINESVEWPFDQFTKRRLGSFDRPPSVYDHPPPWPETLLDPHAEPTAASFEKGELLQSTEPSPKSEG